MAFERVGLIADGRLYEKWESIQLNWNINEVYATFAATTAEMGGLNNADDLNPAFSEWAFPPGTRITVTANDDLVMNGFVDLYGPMVEADQHGVTVTGVTLSKDFAESSVIHESGTFEMMTDSAILQYFAAKSGVPLENRTPPELIPIWQIRQGATYFQESMRLLAARQKSLMPVLPGGGLRAYNGQTIGVNTRGALVQGQNVLKASARITDGGYGQVLVHGQHPRGTDLSSVLQPFGMAIDPSSRRTRTKVLIEQFATSTSLAQRRAEWEIMRAAGKNVQATIEVPGWRDQTGSLWRAGEFIYVNVPYLKIDCMLLAAVVIFKQNNSSGTTTTITLVDGRSVGAPVSACNSGSPWFRSFPFLDPFLGSGGIPGLPGIPGIPGLPDLPSIPGIPGIPGFRKEED